MKQILLLFGWLTYGTVFAQTITTSVQKNFSANDTKGVYEFKQGDKVTIHGFKKKEGKFNFVVETDYFAELLTLSDIPFEADEKQLKKLPNALDLSMQNLIRQKKQDVETRKLQKKREDALNGKIHNIIIKESAIRKEKDALGNLYNGDTVCILGYDFDQTFKSYSFALYTKNAAGTYWTYNTDVFKNEIVFDGLPSSKDVNVKEIIEQKKQKITQEITRRQKEISQQKEKEYRAKALNGEIKAVYLKELEAETQSGSQLLEGDTITIIGYTKRKDRYDRDFFAIYSRTSAGIFRPKYTYSNPFKSIGTINFDLMPSVTDPLVLKIIEKQKQVADSTLREEYARKVSEIKSHDPIIIRINSWEKNTVGGITMNLSVTNCSSQTIKYITFKGCFYNPVGDKCLNEIGGGSVWSAKGVGPIKPAPISENPTNTASDFLNLLDCNGYYKFDDTTFYTKTATSFTLTSVSIQYTNGKTITLSGEKLKGHVIY